MRVSGRVLSLGGGILSGVFVFEAALVVLFFQTSLSLRWFLLALLFVTALYLVDGLSERIWMRDSVIFYDSFLRRRRSIPLGEVRHILLMHEGLNLEPGIEAFIFHLADGTEKIWHLGPLWRRRDLERVLQRALNRHS